MPKTPFSIVFDERVYDHFDAIEHKYDSVIENEIETQLRYEPDVRTRNRKKMDRENTFGASWELRFGPGNRFRVLYAIDEVKHRVIILALVTKIGNRWYVGKEEIQI